MPGAARSSQCLINGVIGMWLFALWPGGHDRTMT
jgi:hypothetical protein